MQLKRAVFILCERLIPGKSKKRSNRAAPSSSALYSSQFEEELAFNCKLSTYRDSRRDEDKPQSKMIQRWWLDSTSESSGSEAARGFENKNKVEKKRRSGREKGKVVFLRSVTAQRK
ncbi:hypothetical protein V6Z11_D08G071000 [Gossypium hirsutum]|nr:hypothetical protein GOBAR_DD17687 [Gossypium barbadense]